MVVTPSASARARTSQPADIPGFSPASQSRFHHQSHHAISKSISPSKSSCVTPIFVEGNFAQRKQRQPRVFGFRVLASGGLGFTVRVSGSGFQVSCFGFRFPVSGFRAPFFGFGFRTPVFVSRAPVFCFGFRVSGFGFRVSCSGFGVLCFVFRDPVLVFRVPGLEFLVPGVGSRVLF